MGDAAAAQPWAEPVAGAGQELGLPEAVHGAAVIDTGEPSGDAEADIAGLLAATQEASRA